MREPAASVRARSAYVGSGTRRAAGAGGAPTWDGAAPGGNSDRIPDESRTQSPDDPEGGLFEDEVVSRNRGSGRTGMQPDPAYPHGGECDPALADPTNR